MKKCDFMPSFIIHENQIWLQCDEDFIVKTVDASSYDVHEVDDEVYYPLTHLASVKWFSNHQLNAFARWLGENGFEEFNDVQEVRWFGPRDNPKMLLGFSPEGKAFIYAGVVRFPEGVGKDNPVSGVSNMGEDYICLHDIAAIDNTDPKNRILFELVSDAAEQLGFDCLPFE